MKNPKSVSQAHDILYVCGDCELDNAKIENIIKDYEPEDGQIRSINYDGGPLGAWVNASIWNEDKQEYSYEWLYVAAGDRDNKQMVAQAAKR
jgi:hypothetical protein